MKLRYLVALSLIAICTATNLRTQDRQAPIEAPADVVHQEEETEQAEEAVAKVEDAAEETPEVTPLEDEDS